MLRVWGVVKPGKPSAQVGTSLGGEQASVFDLVQRLYGLVALSIPPDKIKEDLLLS
jgi:hypothetical protein